MPTPITTPFDNAPPPTIAMVNGTTTFSYGLEFGGYAASADASGNPAWRAFYRDANGQDTILGRVLDVPAWQAFLVANGASPEPMLNSPPPTVTLTAGDAATVGASPHAVAPAGTTPTAKVVSQPWYDKLEAKVKEWGHDLAEIL